MIYKLIILEQALQEIEQAYEYYLQFSFNAMQTFDSQLEKAYQTLENNPFFQFRYKNLRALPFNSLPYMIFFTINEQEKIVYIYSVFNTHQNPEKYPDEF